MNPKVGRNDPCPCGSGLKYKKCCALKSPMQKYKAEVISGHSAISNLFGRVQMYQRPNDLKEKELPKNPES
jgi:hypothetical protein